MKKLTKLEKFGLIAAIITCGTYFYMHKVYDPEAKALAKTVSDLNKTIKEYNDLGDAPPLTPVQSKVKKLSEELEQATADLREAGGRTGERSELTEIMSKITSMAEENRLRVVKMTPAGEEKSELFAWAVYKAELTGGYGDFKRLVTRLAEMPQPVQLRGLKLTRHGDNGRIAISVELLI